MNQARQNSLPCFFKSAQFLTLFLLTIALVLTILAPAHAASKKNKPLYAAFVMDADTGLILHQENAGKKVHPASLTKMMTLLMTFDALERKKLRLSDRVVFSEHAANMAPSKLGIKAGSSISVEQAIYALVTKSANDAACALGEKIAGNESTFAILMTRKARAIGMSNTTFRNASGLHNPQQVTTARDFARLSLTLIRDYPKYYSYFSTTNFMFQGNSLRNHNHLMNTYKGMDGIKTGFINQSGFNLAASAKRDGHRLIGVVFGGTTAKARNDRMAKLLDDGFAKVRSLNGENALIADNKDKNSDTSSKFRNVPVPEKKPIYVAGLGQVYTQSNLAETDDTESSPYQISDIRQPRWKMLDSTNEQSILNRMVGQGDYDSAARNRLETGIIAMAAVTNEDLPPDFFNDDEIERPEQQIQKISTHKVATTRTYTTNQGDEWAVQIGAFSSRDTTNAALNSSLKKLPASLRNVNPVIAPLQASNGSWLFRARLSGYSRQAALKACDILPDCMPIAPHGQ